STTSTTTTTTTSTTTTPASTPTTTSVAGVSWTYLGCYPDPGSPRTLNNGIHTSTNTNTVATCCQSSCAAARYQYAGTEYGICGMFCWCASSITNGASQAASGDCDMCCSGGGGDKCGGGHRRLSPYKVSAVITEPPQTWNYLGCYQALILSRTLNNGMNFASSSLTIQGCQSACAGYTCAGVDWCSNTLKSGVSQASSGECNMACTGANAQMCGGGNRIGIYKVATTSTKRRWWSTPEIGA
ncbi:hypothetical protein R3P38DRAFT_2505653, partial [Favolaschia claudopus]